MASLDAAEDDPRRYGEIFKVAGPLVVASRMSGAFMHELVRVGTKRIVVRTPSLLLSTLWHGQSSTPKCCPYQLRALPHPSPHFPALTLTLPSQHPRPPVPALPFLLLLLLPLPPFIPRPFSAHPQHPRVRSSS